MADTEAAKEHYRRMVEIVEMLEEGRLEAEMNHRPTVAQDYEEMLEQARKMEKKMDFVVSVLMLEDS